MQILLFSILAGFSFFLSIISHERIAELKHYPSLLSRRMILHVERLGFLMISIFFALLCFH